MTLITIHESPAALPSERSTESYWHREPSEALLGHRTTTELPATADVVVVGSGITGAFAARFLKEAEPSSVVVMLEAREVCWGATGRNGGHCQPNVYASSPATAHFELQNFAYLSKLITSNSIPCDWTSLTGVHAFFTPDLFAQAVLNLEGLERRHPDLASKARVVRSAAELATLRVPGAVGAIVQRNAASCWPYKLVCWVLEDLLRRFGGLDGPDDGEGASFNLQTGTPVSQVRRLDSHGEGVQTGGTHWVVHTPRGEILAHKVLLACNGYTSHLVPSFADLIVSVRGQVAALVQQDGGGGPPLQHSYVFMGVPPGDEPVRDDYLIQRPRAAPGMYGRELILGGGRSLGTDRGVGASADDWVDPVVARYLRRTLGPSIGGADGEDEEMEARYEWTGIMGFSRDGCPWVGEIPEDMGGGAGLWMSGAYTGHGMPQAALCAKAVVEMMMANGDGAGDGGVDRGCRSSTMPEEFRLNRDRIWRARRKERVKEADLKNMFI